jgi:hypothetical protein
MRSAASLAQLWLISVIIAGRRWVTDPETVGDDKVGHGTSLLNRLFSGRNSIHSGEWCGLSSETEAAEEKRTTKTVTDSEDQTWQNIDEGGALSNGNLLKPRV